MAMIEVDKLNLSFGEGDEANQVLHDVSIAVNEGEAFGLVGESGSGKTTVLRCLAGQYNHWSGRLTINCISYSFSATTSKASARLTCSPSGLVLFWVASQVPSNFRTAARLVDSRLTVCR